MQKKTMPGKPKPMPKSGKPAAPAKPSAKKPAKAY